MASHKYCYFDDGHAPGVRWVHDGHGRSLLVCAEHAKFVRACVAGEKFLDNVNRRYTEYDANRNLQQKMRERLRSKSRAT
jgi:hypothetical protein